MHVNVPKVTLREANVGDTLKMVGDPGNRTFRVERIRDDGYIDLYCNGRPNVIATPSTEVSFCQRLTIEA